MSFAGKYVMDKRENYEEFAAASGECYNFECLPTKLKATMVNTSRYSSRRQTPGV